MENKINNYTKNLKKLVAQILRISHYNGKANKEEEYGKGRDERKEKGK